MPDDTAPVLGREMILVCPGIELWHYPALLELPTGRTELPERLSMTPKWLDRLRRQPYTYARFSELHPQYLIVTCATDRAVYDTATADCRRIA